MTETHTHTWGTQPEMFGPRHEFRLGLLLRETARLAPGSRVLDAAVGLGQLARRVRSQGHHVFGVDYSFDAALYAHRHNGAPSVVGDFTRLPFRDGVFDGLTTGETLEHLDDDRGAVREIARVLRRGGICVATVPALQILWSASDVYYEHRRRYSRSSLRQMFSEAAMDVGKASFWGFPIVLIYDTLFLLPMNLRRARRGDSGDATLKTVARAGRFRALVHLVQAIFSIDRIFSFVPFGPGLLLVARKKG